MLSVRTRTRRSDAYRLLHEDHYSLAGLPLDRVRPGDVDDDVTRPDPYDDGTPYLARRVSLAMDRVRRNEQKVTWAHLDRFPAAGAELHEELAAQDIRDGVVPTVVVPSGHRTRIRLHEAGPHTISFHGTPSRHARRPRCLLEFMCLHDANTM